jgi:hypothetical protein
MEAQKPENPHLTDIFRTALASTPDRLTPANSATPKIIVNGNNNVISFGGRVVVHGRESSRRRR